MAEALGCKNCGEPFPPRRGGGQYGGGGKPQVHCSDKCRREWARKQLLARKWAQRSTECPECGGPIEQNAVGQPRKFCSEKCKTRATNRRVARARKPAKRGYEKQCAHCGKPFTAIRADRIYCYDSWCGQYAYGERKRAATGLRMQEHHVVCDECGTPFTATHPLARWCKPQCGWKHNHRLAAKRARVDQSIIPFTDRQVFVRDGWVCHLCGDPIDPKLKWPARMCATVDHVLPIFHGGKDELDNVAAAHWKCNHTKGAKAPTE